MRSLLLILFALIWSRDEALSVSEMEGGENDSRFPSAHSLQASSLRGDRSLEGIAGEEYVRVNNPAIVSAGADLRATTGFARGDPLVGGGIP